MQNIMDNTLPENSYSYNSFFYINFGVGTYLTTHAVKYPGDSIGADVTFDLKIEYPSNGIGYDNFIYNGFFGTNKTVLEEQPEDSTRTLKNMIESFEYSVEVISGWKQGTVSRETVEAFSETVKQAHILYNGLRSEAQRAFVTQANIDKMFEVEDALKTVKPLFGLAPSIESVTVASGSAHRSAYTEGERFSTDGLKILVRYDDQTTEEIDAAGNFQLASSYDRALRVSDRTVRLQGVGAYAGRTVGISITVSRNTTPVPEPPSGDNGNGGAKISGGVIAVIVVGAVVLLAAAAVATVLVLKKRKAGAVNGIEEEAASTEVTEEPEATEEKDITEETEETEANQTSEEDKTQNGGEGTDD